MTRNIDITTFKSVMDTNGAIISLPSDTLCNYIKDICFDNAMHHTKGAAGCFIGGRVASGRKEANVLSRSLLTIDIDDAKPGSMVKLSQALPFMNICYHTYSSTAENERFRLLTVLDRDTTADEYKTITKYFIAYLNQHYKDLKDVDPASCKPAQLMHFPTYSENVWGGASDADALNKVIDNNIIANGSNYIDVGAILAKMQYKAPSNAPAKTKAPANSNAGGIVDAFNTAHTIDDAILCFLSDTYKRAGKNRYKLIGSKSGAGLEVYPDKNTCYSFHSNDSAATGHTLDPFNLVRVHMFGHLDKNIAGDALTVNRPSFGAMCDFARNDPQTRAVLASRNHAPVQNNKQGAPGIELEYTKTGGIKATYKNLLTIMRNDPALKGIYFDTWAHCIDVAPANPVPWQRSQTPWTTWDNSLLYNHIFLHYVQFPGRYIDTGLVALANTRRRNPVKEYFEGLQWDGVKRAETLLVDYLGASDTQYTRDVTRKWLIATYRRAVAPENTPVKFDNMLILQGPQGIGKDTIFAMLGGAWFTQDLKITDIRDKVASEKIQGNIINDFPELAGMKKMDSETLKSFITQSEDNYRPPYERQAIKRVRHGTFCGTTNADNFLYDPTGNRRYWIVQVPGKGVNLYDALQYDEAARKSPIIAQVWAEVVQLSKNGEKLYLEGDTLKAALTMQRSAIDAGDEYDNIMTLINMPVPRDWFKKYPCFKRHAIASAYMSGDIEKDKAGSTYISYNNNKIDLSDEPREFVSVKEIYMELTGYDDTTAPNYKNVKKDIQRAVQRSGLFSVNATKVKYKGGDVGAVRCYQRIKK